LVFEPKVAAEWRQSRVRQTRLVANLAARVRQRAALEAYDTMDNTATAADSKVFLDVGSELVAGVGGVYELTPRAVAAVEAQLFVPLPDAIGYGRCHLYTGRSCSTLTSADYWPGAKHGDLTALAVLGMMLRISA